MGMPELIIAFKKLASTAKARSARGVVALIINDSTVTGLHTYTSVTQITESYSASNLALLKMCFKEYGVPKIIVASEANTEDALALLSYVKFNYLAIPFAVTGDNAKVVTFIENQRDSGLKSKAVLVNAPLDNESIINFTATGIKERTVSVTPEVFTVDLACVFATLDLTKSATYYVFEKITAVDKKENPDTAVDNGEIFLINDGEKIKLSRAVNSLKTLTGEKKASMKKIKIMESMDLINSDILSTFEDSYVGQVDNTYNDKVLLISDINTYLEYMTEVGALNKDGTNRVDIDLEAQREYIEKELEIDTSKMTDVQVLHHDTGSKVFLTGQVTFADSIEDISLSLYY